MSSERLLITGAAGFIGRHVTSQAAALPGIDPVAMVLNGDEGAALEAAVPGIEIIEADLTDHDTTARAVQAIQPDRALHMAWYTAHGVYWHSPINLDFVYASAKLFEALADAGCRRIVGVGTCVEYDVSTGYLREDVTSLRPTSLYAASKLSTYHLLTQIAARAGVSWGWSRIFYLYGPGENPNRLVPAVIRALLNGDPIETTEGYQVRDYLHVADVASALLHVTDPAREDGVYNIASGRPVRVRDVVTQIAAMLGGEDLLRLGARPASPGDPAFICGEPARLHRSGWTPRYTLEDGLQHTIDYWRSQP